MKLFMKTLMAAGILCLFAANSKATTYTTLADGDWDSTFNIWSTNGITPCFCAPPSPTEGDTIEINHSIYMTGTINVTGGSVFNVNSTGEFSGPYNLFIDDGTANFFGAVNINKIEISDGSTVNAYSEFIGIQARFVIGGTLNVDGCYIGIFIGNFEVESTGTVNTYNGAKVDLAGGNIENRGTINICADCCFTTLGNWKNQSQGNVFGSGVASTQVGNMQNQGNWDINLMWCSNGSDVGMPTPEDCSSTEDICGVSILPIELIHFDVSKVDDSHSKITWKTAAEYNSDYFVLFKSVDGTQWIEVNRQTAAGNSSELLTYSAIDNELTKGLSYYRLIQVDVDGTRHQSKVLSLNNKPVYKDVLAYPNPVVKGQKVTLVQLQPETAIIQIVDNTGNIVLEQIKNDKAAELKLDVDNLLPGIYTMVIDQKGYHTNCKFIVCQ